MTGTRLQSSLFNEIEIPEPHWHEGGRPRRRGPIHRVTGPAHLPRHALHGSRAPPLPSDPESRSSQGRWSLEKPWKLSLQAKCAAGGFRGRTVPEWLRPSGSNKCQSHMGPSRTRAAGTPGRGNRASGIDHLAPGMNRPLWCGLTSRAGKSPGLVPPNPGLSCQNGG